MNRAEQYFYDRGRYAEIAAKVALAMRHGEKPCLGDGCDLDSPCKRHQRTAEVVERYVRRTQPQQ